MGESAVSDGDPGGAGRRGRSHDAEGTREAILDAGEAVFAEHGFDGARIDAIATASGYNKSLIFQYFEDKLGLYAAVIRRADEQTRQTQNKAMLELMRKNVVEDFNSLRNLLGEYVGWYFDYAVEHPNIIRIFDWEMAEQWQTFSKVLSERDYQDVDQFAPIFARIQKAGLMRPGPNPLLQFTSGIFMVHVFLAVVPFYRMLRPTWKWDSSEAQAEAREFITEFVVNGLLVNPGEKAAARPRKSASKAAHGKRGGRA